MLPSCEGHVEKLLDKDYNAACVSCGSTKDIQLWPHRNGHGMMIGFLFVCALCADVAPNLKMKIMGIRGEG